MAQKVCHCLEKCKGFFVFFVFFSRSHGSLPLKTVAVPRRLWPMPDTLSTKQGSMASDVLADFSWRHLSDLWDKFGEHRAVSLITVSQGVGWDLSVPAAVVPPQPIWRWPRQLANNVFIYRIINFCHLPWPGIFLDQIYWDYLEAIEEYDVDLGKIVKRRSWYLIAL